MLYIISNDLFDSIKLFFTYLIKLYYIHLQLIIVYNIFIRTQVAVTNMLSPSPNIKLRHKEYVLRWMSYFFSPESRFQELILKIFIDCVSQIKENRITASTFNFWIAK